MTEGNTKLKCPDCGKEFPEGEDTTIGEIMETTCPFCKKRFEINDETVIEE
ncbi:hypothetical protein KKG83_05285 [Candidatus Micrarchaeota archaeon]|nr:hypothetical protein [Candidatus Micrarchaeota archaeon]MBU2476857.1 hypothetical protein [Candidatus Micrarchaeota archaeon]